MFKNAISFLNKNKFSFLLLYVLAAVGIYKGVGNVLDQKQALHILSNSQMYLPVAAIALKEPNAAVLYEKEIKETITSSRVNQARGVRTDASQKSSLPKKVKEKSILGQKAQSIQKKIKDSSGKLKKSLAKRTAEKEPPKGNEKVAAVMAQLEFISKQRDQMDNFVDGKDLDSKREATGMKKVFQDKMANNKQNQKSTASRKRVKEKKKLKAFENPYLNLLTMPYQMALNVIDEQVALRKILLPNGRHGTAKSLFELLEAHSLSVDPKTLQIAGGAILLFLYVLFCYPIMSIAKVFNTKSYWMAWLPFFQDIILARMAKHSAWIVVLYFIPFVQIFMVIYLWCRVANGLEKKVWTGIFMPVLGINIFVLWYYLIGYKNVADRYGKALDFEETLKYVKNKNEEEAVIETDDSDHEEESFSEDVDSDKQSVKINE